MEDSFDGVVRRLIAAAKDDRKLAELPSRLDYNGFYSRNS